MSDEVKALAKEQYEFKDINPTPSVNCKLVKPLQLKKAIYKSSDIDTVIDNNLNELSFNYTVVNTQPNQQLSVLICVDFMNNCSKEVK